MNERKLRSVVKTLGVLDSCETFNFSRVLIRPTVTVLFKRRSYSTSNGALAFFSKFTFYVVDVSTRLYALFIVGYPLPPWPLSLHGNHHL